MPVLSPDIAGNDKTQVLEFLGRKIARRELLAERDRLMARMAEAPAGPVLLYLPNSPLGVAAILAALDAGRDLEILDPRQPEENLIARLALNPPSLVITLDLAVTLERLQANLLRETPVVVGRMTALMTPLGRAIFPLMPGSGLTRVPEPPAYRDLEEVDYPASPPPPAARPGDLSFNGKRTQIQPLRPLDPWLMDAPLADPDAVDQLFANLAGGAVTVLSPRLDEKSLTRVAKQAGMLR